MKVYRVLVDTDRWGFTAYYSSIEKAIELLPQHGDWNQAVCSMNRHQYITSGNSFKTLKNQEELRKITLDNNTALRSIDVWLKNAVYKVETQTVHPEVKEDGKPYKAEWIEKFNCGEELETIFLSRIYYKEIELDSCKGRHFD